MEVINGRIVEADEPRYLLEEDSVCYGCQYYDDNENCTTPQICIEGSMNGYRMEG